MLRRMEYGVSLDLHLPSGAGPLDPLQREGAGALLTGVLDQISGADGEDGADVEVDRHWVGVHPEGALVLLVVDAESLEVAEHAARDIMLQVLEHTELLTDWQIASCEVGFDERFVQAGLEAADGPGIPPADVRERARWLAQPPSSVESIDAAGEVDWRTWLVKLAPQLRAFDLDVFDTVTDQEHAKLAAGALIFAATVLVDELFQDLETLSRDGGTVADGDIYFVLDELPPRFAHHYTVRFAHRFLVAAITVTGRLTQHDWSTPACIAEALALRLVVEAAHAMLDEHDLLDEKTHSGLYSGFEDTAFDDADHEWLYQNELDGFEDDPDLKAGLGFGNMHVDGWFDQLPHASGQLHAYVRDLEARRHPPDAD
jgi:hypothetical protein